MMWYSATCQIVICIVHGDLNFNPDFISAAAALLIS